jgi:hypothetical protein
MHVPFHERKGNAMTTIKLSDKQEIEIVRTRDKVSIDVCYRTGIDFALILTPVEAVQLAEGLIAECLPPADFIPKPYPAVRGGRLVPPVA